MNVLNNQALMISDGVFVGNKDGRIRLISLDRMTFILSPCSHPTFFEDMLKFIVEHYPHIRNDRDFIISVDDSGENIIEAFLNYSPNLFPKEFENNSVGQDTTNKDML